MADICRHSTIAVVFAEAGVALVDQLQLDQIIAARGGKLVLMGTAAEDIKCFAFHGRTTHILHVSDRFVSKRDREPSEGLNMHLRLRVSWTSAHLHHGFCERGSGSMRLVE